MVDYPFYDKQPGPERREKLNELYATWENAISNVIKGDKGWSPLIRAVTHLDRVVLELYDWVGGEGIKPTETGYLGDTGYVSDISLAIDFRGPLGAKGDAAIISVGTVTTGAPGTLVQVVNTGTSSAAVFDFTIPRGEDGSGSGDMSKAVYDSLDNGVVNAARAAPWDGLTGKPAVISSGATIEAARAVIDAVSSSELTTGLNNKVDKVAGKGLSTEDFTTAEKTKLSGIAEGATANQTDAYLLDRVNHTGSQAISTVTGLQDSLDSKQNTLISGTNLKTINGESILGSGDLVVGGGGSSGPSLVGSTSVEENTTTTYEITNYNSFSVYSVAVSSGTVSILGSTITFNAPAYTPALVSTLTLTVDGVATHFPISITEKYFDAGVDIDGFSSLVTIQNEWDVGTTYATGANVIVRKGPRSFLEFTSITNGNVGNNPETSPGQWQQIYNNNTNTSGYFGEVFGSKCVIDKGEWSSATTYAIGDMVVVANNVPPLTQADLTAYVSKTASNLNKPPANNPADWEQRNGLPTGTSLAQTLGIGNATPEVLINNDSGWLKFVHQGKIKYIAKKPFMHTVSWNDIAKAEAVYGNRTVRIGSRLFRVSLLSGAEADPSSWTTASTASDNKGAGSEWNELVYRVNVGVPTDGSATNQGGKQVGLNWWNFTDADMVMTFADGNGSYTWCKETLSFSTATRVSCGGASLSRFYGRTSSDPGHYCGWRPCLTLISDEELEGSLYKAEATGVGPSVASLQYDPITDTGYYGEVSSTQFYTGTQISTATGVTGGTLQNDTEGWLKFYWHGQVLFIAKKTYRYNLSWDNINSANAVYGVNLGSTGKKTITHTGGTKYDVKLMKGAIKDPSPASGGGRQWNELLYRVCTGTETGEIGANWANLNPNTDLGINNSNGSYTWCQEVYQPSTALRVVRGSASLSFFNVAASSNTAAYFGWRPCLAFSV